MGGVFVQAKLDEKEDGKVILREGPIQRHLVNHRPHANVIVRPEIRWDWDDDRIAGLENNDDDQTTFGIDTILT